jgi:hypothetical protein
VIDEVTAALFAAAGNDGVNGKGNTAGTDAHEPWPPVDSAALIGAAP